MKCGAGDQLFGVRLPRLRLIQKLALMSPLHFLVTLVAISTLALAEWNFCEVTALTRLFRSFVPIF